MDLHTALWDLPEEHALRAWEDHAGEIARTVLAEVVREHGPSARALSALRSRLPAALAAAEAAARLLGAARARKVAALQGRPIGTRLTRHAGPVAPRKPRR